ncbi:MAG TPA: rod shape-determining protein RodA [Bacteroidales bacterium]|nr:rod shape-determining protein RodA [Bacteroidales bacterium]
MRRGHVIANIDWFTVILFLVMVTLGWLNIFSAVYSEQHPSILDLNQRYGKQFIWICASVIIAIVVMTIDHKFYDFFAYLIYIAVILLLLSVLVAGKEINGARSWFVIGGFQVQPSEFAKPAVALALAKYLSGFNVNVTNFRTFLKASLIIFTPAALILMQPDTGSALVFFSFILPLFREGFPAIILTILIALGILFFMILMLSNFILLLVILLGGFVVWGFMTRSFKNFMSVTLVYALSFGLVYLVMHLAGKERDLYTAGMIALVPSTIFFLVPIIKNRLRKAFYVFAIVIAGIVYTFSVDYAFHHVLSDYQQNRINILLGIQSDPKGAGYNVNQSKIAIGSGGFSGKGFLQGTQTKLHFVPEQSTDFIFCTVGEEWGFLGSLAVVGLFVTLLIRLIQLAERQRSVFARVFGYGVFSVIFFHFAVNIAMTIGLFPVIGIPLPFFSYGGSSLWAFTLMLFIFLRLDAARMEYIR